MAKNPWEEDEVDTPPWEEVSETVIANPIVTSEKEIQPQLPKAVKQNPELALPIMERLKRGMVRGYNQTGVGLNQLANDIGIGEALGVAPQEIQNARAKQLEEEGKGTGFTGFVSETLGNPANLIPMGSQAKGLMSAVKTGGKYGAASGATSADPEDEGFWGRVGKTGISAAAGAVLGPLVEKAAQIPGGLIKMFKKDKVALNPAQKQIVDEINSRPDGKEVIKRAQEHYDRAQKIGVPVTLAEALENEFMMSKVGQLATSPETMGQTQAFFKKRTEKDVPAALDALSAKLGKWKTVDEAADAVGGSAKEAVKRIKKAMVKKADPFYQKAYSHPVLIDDFYINETLNKQSVKDAIKQAKKVAAEEQRPLTDLFVEIDKPNGKVVSRKVQTGTDMYGQPQYTTIKDVEKITVPTVRGWDYVKRKLDDQVNALYGDSATKTEAEAVKRTRDNLRSALTTDVPGYRQALETYSHSASEDLPKITKYLGGLADPDKLPKGTIAPVFSGTKEGTGVIAKELGRNGRRAAAKGKLMQAVEDNKAATDLSVPTKLGYGSDTTKGQFKALLTDPVARGDALFRQFDDTMESVMLAAKGTNKLPFSGSPTNVNNTAGEAVGAIGAAIQTAANPKNPLPWIRKLQSLVDKTQSAQGKRDLAEIMLTEEGQKLVERIQKAQSKMAKNRALKDLDKYVGKSLNKMTAVGIGQNSE